MAGYIRQSVANIINGSKITAPPLNAEFNKIQDAFNSSTGHTHDGSTGNSQPIPLSTSVVGYLPVVNGGVGGKNNTTATANPTTADDATQGYAPGSIWINASTGYTFLCLYNTQNAANWVNIAAVSSVGAGVMAPQTTNTVDIGTSTLQFKDIYVDGTGYIDAVMGETVTTTGDVTIGGALTVTGLSTIGDITTSNIDIDGGSIDGTPIGAGTASTGAFAGLTATGNVTFSGATVASLGTVSSADIDGGSIDAVTLGTNSAVTEAQIDNINIDGNAITSTNANGNIDITPDGNGTVNITKANVTGGSIDGTPVGATTASTGSFTDLSVSGSISGTMTGGLTGDVVGDIYASNTTSKVLESGTNGTDATFTGAVSGDVTSTGTSSFATLTVGTALSFDAGATATISNLVTPTNNGDAATKGYVDTAVSNLVDSAPGTLDTLNELAAALGDDASFSTNVTASIAAKLPLAGGTMTGDITMTDGTSTQHSIVGLADPTTAQGAATKAYADTKVPASGGSMTGDLSMSNNKITDVDTPTSQSDVATKGYVDLATNGVDTTSAAESATQAEASATSASNSAAQASSDASSVASLYDSFDDRYLGAKSSVPNVDNDGDALLAGALYFDTTVNAMKVYSSTNGWVEAGSSVNGILEKYRYVSTSTQTTFSGSDANGNTLAYDTNYVDVYLSGLRLVNGTDYTATSGTSIQLTTAPDTGSTIEIIAFGNFALNNPQRLTATHVDLNAINRTIDDAGVRVLVYDTSKDSDGGVWRYRTKNTSWYNEQLNTSTRGSTRMFPAVAVIVCEDGKMTIYDGDDADLPMWMVFNEGYTYALKEPTYETYFTSSSRIRDLSSIECRDGKFYYTIHTTSNSSANDPVGLHIIDFITEKHTYTNEYQSSGAGTFRRDALIDQRNEDADSTLISTVSLIDHRYTNGVSLYVDTNAPKDPETGMPYPMIAVGGGGFVQVFGNDGSFPDNCTVGSITVKEGSVNNIFSKVHQTGFTPEGDLWYSYGGTSVHGLDDSTYLHFVPKADIPTTIGAFTEEDVEEQYGENHPVDIPNRNGVEIIGPPLTTNQPFDQAGFYCSKDGLVHGHILGPYGGQLSLLHRGGNRNPSTGEGEDMSCWINSRHNTGWLPANPLLITSCFSDPFSAASAVTVNNGDFSTSINLYSIQNGGSLLRPNLQSSDITVTTSGITFTNLADGKGVQTSDSTNTLGTFTLEHPMTLVANRTYKITAMWRKSGSGGTQSVEAYPKFVSATDGSVVADSQNYTPANDDTFSFSTRLERNWYITAPSSVSGQVYVKWFFKKSTVGDVYLDELAVWDETAWTLALEYDDADDVSTNNITPVDMYSGINSSGQLEMYYAGHSTSNAKQFGISVEANKYYSFDYDLISEVSEGLRHKDVREAGTSTRIAESRDSRPAHFYTGDNTSVDIEIELNNDLDASAIIDNVTITPAFPNLAVWNNPLKFSGTIDSHLVNTGCDLYAHQYNGTSSSIYQEYSSDFDFDSNDDFTVMAWVKPSTVDDLRIIVSRYADTGTDPDWSLRRNVDNSYGFSGNNGTIIVSGGSSTQDRWEQVIASRKGGVLSLYVNGVQVGSVSNTDDFTNTGGEIYLGKINPVITSNYVWTGQFALMRIAKGGMTQEMVSKSYKDEKILFTVGAKATFFGTSNTVNAVAFDEDTKTVHAGTTTSREEFSGLRRTGYDSGAVSYSISAVNGLVAED